MFSNINHSSASLPDCAIVELPFRLEGSDDSFHRTPRVHHAGGRRGGSVAARGARTAGERMRRIGVLSSLAADDPQSRVRNAEFERGLQQQAGWIVGRNVQIDYRWSAGDVDRVRQYSEELVALTPEVILAVGASTMKPLQLTTRAVPLVFLQVTDPAPQGASDLCRRGDLV